MTTTLADFTTRVLAMLGDVSANRYASAQTDEAIRAALAEYSRAYPAVAGASFTVTSPGKDQAITTLPAYIQFLTKVQWPADTNPTNNIIHAWYATYPSGVPNLHLQWDQPAAGDVINLVYAANHTISGLDGGCATTIPPVHNDMLALGAAGHAAVDRSIQITEQMTQRASNAAILANWGAARLQEFRAALSLLAMNKSSIFQPREGWKIDRWDRTNDPDNAAIPFDPFF